MRLRFLFGVFCPMIVLLAGCAHGDVSKIVPVAGGKTVVVPLSRDGLKPGEGGGYRVAGAVLTPGKEPRTGVYTFALQALEKPSLRRIQIVDISDETEAPLVDDQNPKFEDSHWHAVTEEISADDPRMKWVFQITASLRVYRITLTKTDGQEVTFNHIALYPPALKSLMRNGWGETY